MDRTLPVAALAMGLGLLVPWAGASAQNRTGVQGWDTFIPPITAPDPAVAASPAGAVYIPGVGFRYVVPGSRVYGWTGYGPRVYGYRAGARHRACRERDWWGFDRCRR
jgi:hypothetical protein